MRTSRKHVPRQFVNYPGNHPGIRGTATNLLEEVIKKCQSSE